MLDYRSFKEIGDLFASGQTEKARRLLMEMQSRCIALRDEMNMLRIRLQSIEDALYLSKNLYEDNGYYWLRTNGLRQGPYCPRCYDAEGAIIRLEKHKLGLECPYCYSTYRHVPGPVSTPLEKQARILHFARQV